jgi:hypothetical protein
MTTYIREPGTYRTSSGTLVHLRSFPDGHIVLDHEDDLMRARSGGDERLVKLSDDPDWPDIRRSGGDPTLFAD